MVGVGQQLRPTGRPGRRQYGTHRRRGIGEVTTEVNTVAAAVTDMDAASSRLQFWSVALAIVATLAAVVSVGLGVAAM